MTAPGRRAVRFCKLAALVSIGCCMLMADSASATHVNLSGTHGPAQVKSDCNKVGGTYWSENGLYGCVNDSKGTAVTCISSSKKCGGWVPKRTTPPGRLGGIRLPPSTGIKSSGGNPPPNGYRHPVNVGGFRSPSGVKTMGGNSAPVIYRTEAHHFGGGHR